MALLPTYATLPLTAVKGKGVWIYDDNGNNYLDMYGGHAVALLGHCHPEVVAAVQKQAKTLFFYSNIVSLPVREQAAEMLTHILPPSHKHIFFCNSGAEANENALKLAMKLTGRSALVAFKGSFHGRTLLASAVTDAPAAHQAMAEWMGDKVTFLPPNDVQQLEKITSATAAVILEPVQSMAGVITFNSTYLRALQQQCQKTGALLIFDEVQTGMGRCGENFFIADGAVTPDMITTAKGLAGGFPIGALFLSDAIAANIKINDLGSTFGGGPLAMAALTATINVLMKDELLSHVQALTQHVKKIFTIPEVLEVRGSGCLLGLKIDRPAQPIIQKLLARNIITGTTKDPQVIRLLPPLIIQKQHFDRLKTALVEELSS